jgi:hypothetical protein
MLYVPARRENLSVISTVTKVNPDDLLNADLKQRVTTEASARLTFAVFRNSHNASGITFCMMSPMPPISILSGPGSVETNNAQL